MSADDRSIVGISLGWNCHPAQHAVQHGFRKRKTDGYQTCPFDLCLSNYQGICDCIEDQFAKFTDPAYLTTIEFEGKPFIYHTHYRFIFNHESPYHADLHIRENWPNGANHFVNNDFKFFRERYDRRISNFQNYLHEGSHIRFLLARYKKDTTRLDQILQKNYPELSYEIIHMSPPEQKEKIIENFKMMQFPKEEIDEEMRTK